MLEVLFTQNSKTKDLSCGVLCSEPSLFFSNYISGIGLSLFKITHKTDNNTYGLSPIRIVIEVWCKIQSLIFNKGVGVKQLEISMASLLLQLTILMYHTLFI